MTICVYRGDSHVATSKQCLKYIQVETLKTTAVGLSYRDAAARCAAKNVITAVTDTGAQSPSAGPGTVVVNDIVHKLCELNIISYIKREWAIITF